MLVSIDGKEHAEIKGDGRTLEELLEDVKGVMAGSDRMIVGIECDGRLLRPDEMTEALRQPADRFWQIDFHTTRPRELAVEALQAARTMINDIADLSETAAESLSQSQIKEAMDRLNQLFLNWNTVYQGTHNAMKLMKIEPESIELTNGTAALAMNRLLEQLKEVKGALEQRDYVQLADVLTYELSPLAQDWQLLVDRLVEFIQEQ